jgi:hypothetical protein
MTQMSTSIRSEIAEIKNLILNMSANKRGRKQRKNKDSEVASTSSAEQEGGDRWNYMMNSRTIWKRPGIACVSLKITETHQE